jgi:hypothetical protein
MHTTFQEFLLAHTLDDENILQQWAKFHATLLYLH